MKYVYHGSSIPNLKIIKPNESSHMKSWIYACTSKAISTIFLSSVGNDLYYSLSGDGVSFPVELVERKKGMLKEIFNCSGYIYKLDASNFKSGQTGWSAEMVSDREEKVVDVTYVENVYNELIKLNDDGIIKLYLYPERPSRIPLDNSDLIFKIIRWSKHGFDINIFLNLYPELEDKFFQMFNEELSKTEK